VGLFSIRHTLRSSTRFAQIISVLVRHGFGHFVVSLHLERLVPFRKKLSRRPPEGEDISSIAHRVARVLEDLGPTFIKLGQAMASRPDLMPTEFQVAFRRLHDGVRPFPAEQARRAVAKSLGKPVEELFDAFDDTPVACGSIGQVHHATLPGGESVVVKIKRPDIQQVVTNDIALLRTLAELVERHLPQYRMYRPRMLVEEFAHTLRHELDFVNEGAVTSRFHESFGDDATIRTPKVFWDLSSRDVLTLERLEGTTVSPETDFAALGLDRKALAHRLLDAFFRQYFEMGVFHADPHPGNLFARSGNRWSLIDFGQVGRLDSGMQSRLATLLEAAVRRDLDLVLDVLDDLGTLPEEVDRGHLKKDLATLLDKYYGLPMKRILITTVFEEVVELAREHRVILPSDFVLLGKSLATVGGVALMLDPDCSPIEIIGPKLRPLMLERFSPKRIGLGLRSNAYHLSSILHDGPHMLRTLMRNIMRGKMRIVFRHDGLDNLISELDRSSNRIAFSVVVAAIILGSSVIMLANVGPKWGGTPVLGLLGFLMAGISGAMLLVSIWRSGRL
jgi:ubiquinone biosynthesis protein